MNRKTAVAAATVLAVGIATPMEGLKLTPYYDPPGILTVCRGHTGPDVIPGKKYSLKECDALFNDDMRQAINTVERCNPGLPAPILAAFADAVFNLGPRVACDREHSTAARYLASGRLEDACQQLLRWNKARVFGVMQELPGLTKRRALERDLCLKGVPA